jgi:hypothetical protein
MDNLNTEIGIIINDKKVMTLICDSCADSATPKMIKEAYERKEKNVGVVLKKLNEAAAQIGYKLVPIEAQIQTSQLQLQPQLPQPQQSQPTKTIKLPPPPKASGASIDKPYIKITQDGKAIELNSKVLEAQTFKSNTRPPTTIPKKIVDQSGETTINIIDTGGDKALQETFKQEHISTYLNDCSVCKGTGRVMNGNKCPRCNGIGMIR